MDLGKASMISKKKSSASLCIYLTFSFVRLASSFPLNFSFCSLKIFAKEGRKEGREAGGKKKEREERKGYIYAIFDLTFIFRVILKLGFKWIKKL